MTGFSRRSTIRLAMASALAMKLSGTAGSAQTVGGGLIAPPQGGMIYRRSVERELVDGATLRCSRDFAVDFRPFAEGYMLHGHQVAVSVDAPPALARFAALEEQRDESSVFPIALNGFGQIRSTGYVAPEAGAIRAAFEQALTAIGTQEIAESERDRMRQFIAAFHSAGQRMAAVLPEDLFAPSATERRSEQDISLPGGGIGQVETLFQGEVDAATGLMAHASRVIVTRLEGSERSIRESWNLSRA